MSTNGQPDALDAMTAALMTEIEELRQTRKQAAHAASATVTLSVAVNKLVTATEKLHGELREATVLLSRIDETRDTKGQEYQMLARQLLDRVDHTVVRHATVAARIQRTATKIQQATAERLAVLADNVKDTQRAAEATGSHRLPPPDLVGSSIDRFARMDLAGKIIIAIVLVVALLTVGAKAGSQLWPRADETHTERRP